MVRTEVMVACAPSARVARTCRVRFKACADVDATTSHTRPSPNRINEVDQLFCVYPQLLVGPLGLSASPPSSPPLSLRLLLSGRSAFRAATFAAQNMGACGHQGKPRMNTSPRSCSHRRGRLSKTSHAFIAPSMRGRSNSTRPDLERTLQQLRSRQSPNVCGAWLPSPASCRACLGDEIASSASRGALNGGVVLQTSYFPTRALRDHQDVTILPEASEAKCWANLQPDEPQG